MTIYRVMNLRETFKTDRRDTNIGGKKHNVNMDPMLSLNINLH